MNRAAGPSAWPLSLRLVILVGAPLLLVLGVATRVPARWFRGLDEVDPRQRAERLERRFQDLLYEASQIADVALVRSPRQAAARAKTGPLAGRLEGVGVLREREGYVDWEGRPTSPGPLLFRQEAPRWSIFPQGVRVRLLARGGGTPGGTASIAVFLLHSRLDDRPFDALLPDELRRGVDLEFRFFDTDEPFAAREAPGTERPSAASAARPAGEAQEFPLRAPDGTAFATVDLHPLPAAALRAHARAVSWAWAILVATLLAGLLFRWRHLADSNLGLILLAVLLLGLRAAWLWSRAPALLLSRELGTASLYGSATGRGLLASPADLLLTTLPLYLLARALAHRATRIAGARPRAGAALALVGAGLATALTLWLVASLASDSRIALLERTGLWNWDAGTVLALCLALALLGAAELWGAAWRLLRGSPAPRGPLTGRTSVAVAALFLAALCSLLLEIRVERLELQRLRSEFAPQVLEQSSRRTLALSAALRHVQQAYSEQPEQSLPYDASPEYLAYSFWVNSELFFNGYKSSLDFYTPHGDPVNHFGFGLPPLDETITRGQMPPDATTIREETFDPVVAVQQKLIHGELPVYRDGEALGVVVGHVLDEPENLPFLPWSRPYLAALGPGPPHRAVPGRGAAPDYVLYDERGGVVLSTLPQPPPRERRIVETAAREQSLRVRAADQLFDAVPVQDGRRLHLLLVPVSRPIERLASVVRLALLGVLLLLLGDLLPRLMRRGGPAGLLRELRGSFSRKLLAALLVASVLPLVGLGLILRGYIESRADAALIASANRYVGAAQRVLEDYAAAELEAGEELDLRLNDEVLYWLRRVVGQEIHVYERGLLLATSMRELFASGLLPPRVDGEVQRRIFDEGLPSLVVPAELGPTRMPVAYAALSRVDPARQLLVAVPLVLQQQQIAREVDRVVERILLATVLLVGLLAVSAGRLARTVARPVRELVDATSRIAAGDYATRLEARTRDEIAELVRGFNGMASALAEQRADLERRREYMERLLAHATLGVISTDPEGRIVTFNPAAVKLLAPAAEGLRAGLSLVEALEGSPELRPLAAALPAPQARGEELEVDLEREGEPRRYSLVQVELPQAAGGEAGRLLLLDDVTERMRSNQLAAWAEMARAIAHEIKNPLTPIQLSAEHLRRLLVDRELLTSPDVEACLETIVKQVRTLYEIAGEFSDYAKLPKLDRQPADVVEFVRETLAPYRAAAPPRTRIEERYTSTPPVAMDRRVLSRALINLVENALQAMPEGGRLSVVVESAAAGREVLISVTDEGPGLAPEVRKRLFEPYFSTKSSGTGLGLAIALRAVEAHQGRIEVASERGRGTRFRIHLPALVAD